MVCLLVCLIFCMNIHLQITNRMLHTSFQQSIILEMRLMGMTRSQIILNFYSKVDTSVTKKTCLYCEDTLSCQNWKWLVNSAFWSRHFRWDCSPKFFICSNGFVDTQYRNMACNAWHTIPHVIKLNIDTLEYYMLLAFFKKLWYVRTYIRSGEEAITPSLSCWQHLT